jgi:hypothetical protein
MRRPPAPIPPTPPTRVDRFVLWTRDNRIVASLIIVGLVVGAVGSFADSVKKFIGAVAEIVGAARGPTAEELASRAQVQRAAQLVDTFFARAIGEQTLDFRPPTRDEYQEMQSALRALVVTFNAEKQPEKAKTAEMATELLEKLWVPGHIEPSDWQVERLQSQRQEWNAVFEALGHPMPGEASSSARATNP